MALSLPTATVQRKESTLTKKGNAAANKSWKHYKGGSHIFQVYVNHSASAEDLLTQTMAEWKFNLAVVAEPYRVPDRTDWTGDKLSSVYRYHEKNLRTHPSFKGLDQRTPVSLRPHGVR